MKKSLPCITAFCILLTACSQAPMPDRTKGPEAAFQAAREALHRKDLAAYFDAMAEADVRSTLANSIMICLLPDQPEAIAALRDAGFVPSAGCWDIMKKYGWAAPKTRPADESAPVFIDAVKRIKQPREMAAALEANHRDKGSGSSFVWTYLDDVQIKDIVIHGDTATATAIWAGVAQPARFERDATGWRFSPAYEASPQ